MTTTSSSRQVIHPANTEKFAHDGKPARLPLPELTGNVRVDKSRYTDPYSKDGGYMPL